MPYSLPTKQYFKNTFNQATDTYDAYASLQQSIADLLAQDLQQWGKVKRDILDVGCGTGMSIGSLMRHFSYRHLYGLDFADRLLDKAIMKYSDRTTSFILADFDDIPILCRDRTMLFDVIFSNMALQWSLNLAASLSGMELTLSQQGLIAFSLPLSGTFSEIQTAYRNTFYTWSQVLASLPHSCEWLWTKSLRFHEKFDTLRAAVTSIKKVGANARWQRDRSLSGISMPRSIRALFYDPDMTGLTYCIGFFIARKR